MFSLRSGPPKATDPLRLSPSPRVHCVARSQQGLSLIELLVVISVIGFLTAIATPIVSNIFNQATKSAAQTTAKQIAQAAVAATAAGNSEIFEAASLDDAIEAVLDGLTFQIGQETTSYELGNIPDEHLIEAKKYLGWQDKVILFMPQGVSDESQSSNAVAPPMMILAVGAESN